MFICYLDESGTPQKGDQSANFIYAGLAIPISTWKEKDTQISAIKKRHALEGQEIHTAWILRKYVEQVKIDGFENLSHVDRATKVCELRIQELNKMDMAKDIKNKKAKLKFHRETCQYIHLTLAERKAFIDEICSCISGWEDSRIFFHAIKKEKYDDSLHNVGGIYEDSFCQVVTRFQKFLENISNGGQQQFGMLVSDNNDSVKEKLTKLTRNFHKLGAFWRQIPNIVETPLFVDSKQTSMIQLADVIAYFLRRYFDASEKDHFDQLALRFDKYYGKMEGGRHFTPQEKCTCDVCTLVARQHPKRPRY